jgi:hypothetical protein
MPSKSQGRKANSDSARAEELRVKEYEYRKAREAEGRPIDSDTQSFMDFNSAAAAQEVKEAMDAWLKAFGPKPTPGKTTEWKPSITSLPCPSL